MKLTVRVTINGRLYEEDVEPRLLLSHFLRENIGLTGTHVGCVVGECGAIRSFLLRLLPILPIHPLRIDLVTDQM
jgi:xanthine dehydrogenase iron-sulfur cluster and FAD-binding subunit A